MDMTPSQEMVDEEVVIKKVSEEVGKERMKRWELTVCLCVGGIPHALAWSHSQPPPPHFL